MVTCGGDASAWTRASLTEDQGFEKRGGRPNVDDLQTPEPVVCEQRDGPTPSHPEPGRETSQRRRYWRDARWETRSVHPPTRRGAVAARRAHNPKVGGSNPPAATTRTDTPRLQECLQAGGIGISGQCSTVVTGGCVSLAGERPTAPASSTCVMVATISTVGAWRLALAPAAR